MASKGLTVKVPVGKVIKALELKLSQVESIHNAEASNEAKYQKKYDVWRKQIAKYAVNNFVKAENIRVSYRSWNSIVNVDFDVNTTGANFPDEPKKDFESIAEWKYQEMVEEINNALRVLRMTDEQYVSTSTMRSISAYL